MEKLSQAEVEALAPTREFLREAFKSDLEITPDKLTELQTSLDAALEDLEQLREEEKSRVDSKGKFTAFTREEINRTLAELYPDVAPLTSPPFPDFDLLHPSLQGLIDKNPRVKNMHNVMFDRQGKPRAEKLTPINVTKMMLLQVRPVLVFAQERSMRAVEDLNETDLQVLASPEAVA